MTQWLDNPTWSKTEGSPRGTQRPLSMVESPSSAMCVFADRVPDCWFPMRHTRHRHSFLGHNCLRVIDAGSKDCYSVVNQSTMANQPPRRAKTKASERSQIKVREFAHWIWWDRLIFMWFWFYSLFLWGMVAWETVTSFTNKLQLYLRTRKLDL